VFILRMGTHKEVIRASFPHKPISIRPTLSSNGSRITRRQFAYPRASACISAKPNDVIIGKKVQIVPAAGLSPRGDLIDPAF
jgi:hypothetical protein